MLTILTHLIAADADIHPKDGDEKYTE